MSSSRRLTVAKVLLGTAVLTLVASAVHIGYSYWSRWRKLRKLQYPVPSIWQHKSELPGTWQRTFIIGPTPSQGKYQIAFFEDNSDFIAENGATFTAQEVNDAITRHLEKGYRQLDYEEYREAYGLGDTVDEEISDDGGDEAVSPDPVPA